MFKKSERGFTLIELLVVIAILGVLSGIAVPRVLTSLADARLRANEANMQIIQSAVERLAIDQSLNTLANWNTALGTSLVLSPPDNVTDITGTVATALQRYVSRMPASPLNGVYTITLTDADPGTAVIVVATVGHRIP